MPRHFKNWIKEYIEYSAASEAPDRFHFWTAVSTIAGALRRQVWIDQKYFQWVPNFYIVFVAPPGIVQKSTTANIGMDLLREVPDVRFGPDVATWQALVQDLTEAATEFEMTGPDGEPEYYPMSALTISSSEFGTFLNPDDRQMVDTLVHLWDGRKEPFKKSTKTQGDDTVINPWVNIIGCTTPGWISGNFSQYTIDGGLTSRCVWVYADRKRNLVAYPGDYVDPNFAEQRQKLIEDLIEISQLKGEFAISKEAKEWGIEWYNNLWFHRPEHLKDPRLDSYVSRKQTMMHKLAMVVSASQRSDLIITKEDLETSNAMLSHLEGDILKVFSGIGSSEAARLTATIEAVFKDYPEIEEQQLARLVMGRMSHQELQVGLQSLMAAGLLQRTARGSTAYYRYLGESSGKVEEQNA